MPYYLVGPGRAVVQEVYKKYKINWGEGMMVYFDKNKCLWYNRQSEIDDNGYKAAKLIYKSKAQEKKLKKHYADVISYITGFRRDLAPAVLKGLDDTQLSTTFERVLKIYDIFWSVATLAELAGYGATAHLQAHQENIPLFPNADPLHILTSAADFTFYQKEELEFLKLIGKFHKNFHGKKSELAFLKHTKKYNWLLNNFASGKPLKPDYFYKRAAQYLKKDSKPLQTAARIKKELLETNRKRKKITALIKDPETKFYARIAGDALAWHDDRKGRQMRMQTVLHYFLQEFSRRFNLPENKLVQLLPNELKALIRKQKTIKDFPIVSRQKLMITYVTIKNLHFVQGKEAKQIVNAYQRLQQSNDKTGHLQGLVASTGNRAEITGKVKVVRDASELNKMREGFILIAQFTSPDYIMAIRKASAIITDIGGLNSHAAVVSRELGIPCIVNTKLATKVFKDGDFIKIDVKQGRIEKV